MLRALLSHLIGQAGKERLHQPTHTQSNPVVMTTCPSSDLFNLPSPYSRYPKPSPRTFNHPSPTRLVKGKTVGKKFLYFLARNITSDLRCHPPTSHANHIDPEFPTPFSQIGLFSPVLYSAHKRTVCILSYGRTLAGVSHLAIAAFQCPMLCADSMRKIGLHIDYNDHCNVWSSAEGGQTHFETKMILTKFSP